MPNLPYSNNVLLTVTAESKVKTDVLVVNSQNTFDSEGLLDAEILVMGTYLKPFSTSYHSKYLSFSLNERLGLSATKRMEAFIDAIPRVLEKTERLVLNVFDKDMDGYKIPFPKPRSTIYEGATYHDKFTNLETLSSLLAIPVGLAAAKTYLDAFIAPFKIAIKDAFDGQKSLAKASEEVEEARIIWCNEAFGVLGELMKKYRNTPFKIDKFCDLSIFNSRQSHLDPDKDTTKTELPIAKITCINMVFDPTKTYYLHNTGPTDLEVGSADASTTDPIPKPLALAIGETLKVEGTALGDAINRNLLVYNPDPNLPGEILIKEIIL